MSLRASYTLLAPLYDLIVARASAASRARSLAALANLPPTNVLLSGIGTGLDLPHAPPQHRYVGLDLTAAMLARVPPSTNLALVQGDSQRLPFNDESFDHAVLHLILAVVPDAYKCLPETLRVTKPGGRILIFDKFIPRGRPAPLRRLLSPLARQIATGLDVVFEDVLERCPNARLCKDEPALGGGWFRLIQLEKL